MALDLRHTSLMKALRVFLTVLSLAAWCGAAEQTPSAPISTPATNAPDFRADTPRSDTTLAPLAAMELRQSRDDVITGKNFEFSGPLVRPFKGKRGWGPPLRFLQLFSPFAPTEPKVETASTPVESPRAWSSVVGWSPGVSAFPDPTTHEPQLKLISVSAKPRE